MTTPDVEVGVGLGSCSGDRKAEMEAAVEFLRGLPGSAAVEVSSFHETSPELCPPGTGSFLNAVAVFRSALSPDELLARLQHYEVSRGRRPPHSRNGSRPVDLDLLYHGDTALRLPHLQLPHPRMASRRFVLEPLAELRPAKNLPGIGMTVRDALKMVRGRVTAEQVRTWKRRETPFLAVTAYDYPTARLLDEAGVDILHVGDTLGMVVLGYPDTTWVTMDEMVHHVAAVARGRRRALVTADLVAGSYDTPEQAVASSWRLLDAGADAVKMEGGHEIEKQIRAVLEAGIPVQGHLGLLPQTAAATGGYRRHGREAEEMRLLKEDARLLDASGCFSCVLECVVPDVALALTEAVNMPTVGIASGAVCDGEIRVVHDLLGAFPWYQPKYVKPLDTFGERTRDAVRRLREQMLDERHPGGRT